MPDGMRSGHIARTAGINAPQVSAAGPMLGILSHPDEHLAVDTDRRGDDVVLRAVTAKFPYRAGGVAVELPDQRARRRFECVDPTVAAGEDGLRLALDQAQSGRRPLPVQDAILNRKLPGQRTGILLERDEARCDPRWDVEVPFIDAVATHKHDEVIVHQG